MVGAGLHLWRRTLDQHTTPGTIPKVLWDPFLEPFGQSLYHRIAVVWVTKFGTREGDRAPNLSEEQSLIKTDPPLLHNLPNDRRRLIIFYGGVLVPRVKRKENEVLRRTN